MDYTCLIPKDTPNINRLSNGDLFKIAKTKGKIYQLSDFDKIYRRFDSKRFSIRILNGLVKLK